MKKAIHLLLISIFLCLFIFDAKADLSESLVAFYPFAGNANDASGNNNHGGVNEAVLVPDRFGTANSAYFFDGVNDYIRIPHSESLNISQNITLSCWVMKSTTAACYEDIFMKGNDSYGLQFSCDATGSPMFHLTGSGWKNLNADFTPVTDTWYHILGTYDGLVQKIYINGELKKSVEWSAPISTNNSPLDIGYQVAGDNAFFNGSIDEIRVYNRALTEAEAMEIFHLESNSNQGLVAYYPFNGNANDASGNNNHGTVNEAVLVPDRFGTANSAYNFDGVNDYIRIPHSESLDISQIITLSCWVKKTATAACYEDIFMKGNDAYGLQFSCDATGSPMLHLTANGWKNLNSDFTPVTDTWYHVLGTYDGFVQKIYINGELKKSVEWSAPINTNTSPLDVGYQVAGDNAFFNGAIDEIRIYNRALSDAEVAVLADKPDGISSMFRNGKTKIYPNPANDRLVLENMNPNSTVSISSMEGKVIYSKQKLQTREIIDISNLCHGIYLITIHDENTVQVEKIVKE